MVADEALDEVPLPVRPKAAAADLRGAGGGNRPPARMETLARLLTLVSDDAGVIASTGKSGRELFTLADREQHLYQVGSMGCAAGMGLGVALNNSRPVVVLDGDGAALMKMGTIATVGAYAPRNLVHVVLDNGVHDSTGGQSTVSANVEFADIAAACGYASAAKCDTLGGFEQAFVVQARDGKRALRQGRWWMIPHFWNKPLKQLPAAFNARAEELSQKPFWRDAFRQYRCLVPATGWREFKPEGKLKQPYQFRLERRLFAFAGLWSRWTSPDGELVESFAVVTTATNEQAAAFQFMLARLQARAVIDYAVEPAAIPITASDAGAAGKGTAGSSRSTATGAVPLIGELVTRPSCRLQNSSGLNPARARPPGPVRPPAARHGRGVFPPPRPRPSAPARALVG